MRSVKPKRGERGFTLLEALLATFIMAIAVVTLMANLTTSTRNLLVGTEMDRLTLLSKSKMDELITQAGPLNGVVEGVHPEGGWRATVTLEAVSAGSADRLEHIVLETWLMSGARRRSLVLETYRRVPGPGSTGG
ncbi:MAG: type II secretion system protein [Bryobacter sp.]|nr:type II secretion system protein [Bryobacter sp.]